MQTTPEYYTHVHLLHCDVLSNLEGEEEGDQDNKVSLPEIGRCHLETNFEIVTSVDDRLARLGTEERADLIEP